MKITRHKKFVVYFSQAPLCRGDSAYHGDSMRKEAKARIKINELLVETGWKVFHDSDGKANIILENNVKITVNQINAFCENFETTKNGFVDFLLLDRN